MSKASEANVKADSISMVCALVLGSRFLIQPVLNCLLGVFHIAEDMFAITLDENCMCLFPKKKVCMDNYQHDCLLFFYGLDSTL